MRKKDEKRKNLKLFRVEKDYTQAEMAALLGVTRTTYCNIEKGKSKGAIEFWLKMKTVFPEIEIDELAKVEGA